MTYQRVTLIGNVANPQELKFTANGDAVLSFSVATSEKWKDKNGDKKEKTTWFKVTIWRKMAEVLAPYILKGNQIYVEGTLAAEKDGGGPRIWKDSEGNPRASFEVTATIVKLLGGKRGDSAGDSNDSAPISVSQEDEIPF